jgi:hypothetical protein
MRDSILWFNYGLLGQLKSREKVLYHLVFLLRGWLRVLKLSHLLLDRLDVRIILLFLLCHLCFKGCFLCYCLGLNFVIGCIRNNIMRRLFLRILMFRFFMVLSLFHRFRRVLMICFSRLYFLGINFRICFLRGVLRLGRRLWHFLNYKYKLIITREWIRLNNSWIKSLELLLLTRLNWLSHQHHLARSWQSGPYLARWE